MPDIKNFLGSNNTNIVALIRIVNHNCILVIGVYAFPIKLKAVCKTFSVDAKYLELQNWIDEGSKRSMICLM